jgi:hypothetical protein
MDLKLVSVHFPKAAGTSLAAELRSKFGDGLHLDRDHDPGNPDHDLTSAPSLSAATCAVHGHFRGDRYSFCRRATHITFLRHPVTNLISIYYFWKTHPHHGNALHDRFIAEDPSIFEFARRSPLRFLMSELYFGGVDMNMFDFIGFYERRRDDLKLLSAMLGILFYNVHENRTNSIHLDERRELEADNKRLEELRHILAKDVSFYETLFIQRAHKVTTDAACPIGDCISS